eukprot:GDKJ01056662.1.p1 GENE.GDKJ01056662.1~~GDKJ01056662.1.p1  ORF type:complete len:647 (+),score=202.86 GDKJ01056662.1:64-2004(+)
MTNYDYRAGKVSSSMYMPAGTSPNATRTPHCDRPLVCSTFAVEKPEKIFEKSTLELKELLTDRFSYDRFDPRGRPAKTFNPKNLGSNFNCGQLTDSVQVSPTRGVRCFDETNGFAIRTANDSSAFQSRPIGLGPDAFGQTNLRGPTPGIRTLVRCRSESPALPQHNNADMLSTTDEKRTITSASFAPPVRTMSKVSPPSVSSSVKNTQQQVLMPSTVNITSQLFARSSYLTPDVASPHAKGAFTNFMQQGGVASPQAVSSVASTSAPSVSSSASSTSSSTVTSRDSQELKTLMQKSLTAARSAVDEAKRHLLLSSSSSSSSKMSHCSNNDSALSNAVFNQVVGVSTNNKSAAAAFNPHLQQQQQFGTFRLLDSVFNKDNHTSSISSKIGQERGRRDFDALRSQQQNGNSQNLQNLTASKVHVQDLMRMSAFQATTVPAISHEAFKATIAGTSWNYVNNPTTETATANICEQKKKKSTASPSTYHLKAKSTFKEVGLFPANEMIDQQGAASPGGVSSFALCERHLPTDDDYPAGVRLNNSIMRMTDVSPTLRGKFTFDLEKSRGLNKPVEGRRRDMDMHAHPVGTWVEHQASAPPAACQVEHDDQGEYNRRFNESMGVKAVLSGEKKRKRKTARRELKNGKNREFLI